MKKILYITTISNTINAFLVPHIKYLITKGYKVDCAASLNRDIDKELIERGVNFFDIPFSRNPLDIGNIKAFKNLIDIQNKNQYDIVHVHTPIAAMYGRLLKIKFRNLKTIYTAHGFHFYKGAPKKNWAIYYPIEKTMAKFTDTIITMNQEDYESALKFNIKNTYKIDGVGLDLNKYNPDLFNKSEVRSELGLKEDDFVILMIAAVNYNKNHIQMIEAVDILKKKGIEIRVLCAGKGPLSEKINNEIISRDLNDNIKMLGYRSDIPKLISACDVGMLLSYREGLPRNIMELLAYGKPVIGSNIRGIRDLVKDRETGILVGLNDYEGTVRAIENIMYNVDVNNIRERCNKEIKKYDMVNILEEIGTIFNERYKL